MIMLPSHRVLLAKVSWIVAAASAIAGAAAPLHAGTLHVPGDAATIQQAIVAAGNGDTILVSAGTYVEAIDFLGKRLVVQSVAGAAATTIDAAGAGTVVSLQNAEPIGTALRGFTITGGATGVLVIVNAQFPFVGIGGGGVFVGQDAHLDLRDCVITGNTVASATMTAYGGGLALHAATVTLTDCTLSNNTAKKGGAISNMDGGSQLTLNGCTITQNVATDASGSGAIDLYFGGFVATNCSVTDNTGSGLRAQGTGPYTGCVFSGNTGWGCRLFGPVGVDLYDCSFLGNGLGGATILGGGFQTTHFVKRCVFAEGDGILSGDDTVISSCAFDGSPFSLSGFTVSLVNCIVRNRVGGVPGNVTYSDVQGGAAGTGNIDADPQWVNAAGHDYHLAAGSPCINAGDPATPLDADHSLADMGPFPYAAWADLGGGIPASATSLSTLPRLTGQGLLSSGQTVGLALTNAPPLKSTFLILSASQLGTNFKGGILWPSLSVVIPGLVTNATGNLSLAATWPVSVPSGASILAQFWFKSTTAAQSFGASNGVRGTAP